MGLTVTTLVHSRICDSYHNIIIAVYLTDYISHRVISDRTMLGESTMH